MAIIIKIVIIIAFNSYLRKRVIKTIIITFNLNFIQEVFIIKKYFNQKKEVTTAIMATITIIMNLMSFSLIIEIVIIVSSFLNILFIKMQNFNSHTF